MAEPGDRPAAIRWLLTWWVRGTDGIDESGELVFHDEAGARRTARDFVHTCQGWPRANVRLAKEVRRVSLVTLERGNRWEASRWQQATDWDGGAPVDVVEVWNHDANDIKPDTSGSTLEDAQPQLLEEIQA
jgi:hypothetical protein